MATRFNEAGLPSTKAMTRGGNAWKEAGYPVEGNTGGEGEDSTPTQTLDSGAAAPRISADEVKAKLDAGANIVIVDARSKTSYETEHIVGAISIPEGDLTDANNNPLSPEEIAQRYSDLQSYDEIITYCY